MIRRIIVASDFSTRSDRALRRGTLLARQMGAELTLVHVVDDDQSAQLVRWQVNAALSVLEENARTIRDYDLVPAVARIVSGDVAKAILETADEEDSDLIILGPHRQKLRDLFSGTTAERTIARSRRPILIAAGVPSAAYDRALLALDMEEHERSVARRVKQLGLLGAGSIVAMHAFDVPARRMMERSMVEKHKVDEYVLVEDAAAADALDRFTAQTKLEPTRKIVLPIIGSASRTILETASDEKAQLIIVGTNQRKGIERLVIGSVAQKVLTETDRDVLVIPK